MLRLRGNVVISIMILFTLFLAACTTQVSRPTLSPEPNPTLNPALVPEAENSAVIRDRTGRLWDVTHARDVYGMNPDYFNYGLGIGAISSVDAPIVFEEGDSGYPSSDSHIMVFGVNHNDEQRAYNVGALSRREVFNDIYPGESNQYLSVAY